MIDKLEVIIPGHAQFGGEFAHVHRELRGDPKFGPFRPSKHYRAVADLRPYGWDAIMHLEQKRYGTHKVELLDTGKKTMEQLCGTLEDLVSHDPFAYKVSRVDLATDVPDVPLGWFREHVRWQFKQWLCTHGKERIEIEFSEMGKKAYQTLYFGKRPSCVRIYDKVAERRAEFELWKKRQIREARKATLEETIIQRADHLAPAVLPELPSFEEWLIQDLGCALPVQGELSGMEQPRQLAFSVITRVENQMGGCVPQELCTVARICRHAHEFNPFKRIEIVDGSRVTPDPFARDKHGSYRYSMTQYLAGVGLRTLWNEIGAAGVSTLLNRDRNRKRLLESLADFVPAQESAGVTALELYERYQQSISRQLAA